MTDIVALDAKIRAAVEQIEAWMLELETYLDEMIACKGYLKLEPGFRSLGEYCADVFKDSARVKLSEGRKELHIMFYSKGLSQRDIAAVTGVDQKTVSNDVRTEEISSVGDTTVSHNGSVRKRPPKPKADNVIDLEQSRSRPRSKAHCDERDGFHTTIKMITGQLIAVTDNPTLAQIQKLRKLLERYLAKLNKLEQEIQNVNHASEA